MQANKLNINFEKTMEYPRPMWNESSGPGYSFKDFEAGEII
jgi:hypothetical protein